MSESLRAWLITIGYLLVAVAITAAVVLLIGEPSTATQYAPPNLA